MPALGFSVSNGCPVPPAAESLSRPRQVSPWGSASPSPGARFQVEPLLEARGCQRGLGGDESAASSPFQLESGRMGEGVIKEPEGGKGERGGFEDKQGQSHHLPLAKARRPVSLEPGTPGSDSWLHHSPAGRRPWASLSFRAVLSVTCLSAL